MIHQVTGGCRLLILIPVTVPPATEAPATIYAGVG